MKHVTIYTDGACSGNPGPGGLGAVLLYGEHRREIAEGYERTTSNRMELLAVIRALEALKEPCEVCVRSDSQYVVEAMQSAWPARWQSRGWKNAAGDPTKNVDLWTALLAAVERHEVRFEWVRGHRGDTENEVCDRLAKQAAAAQQGLQPDPAYEEQGALPVAPQAAQ